MVLFTPMKFAFQPLLAVIIFNVFNFKHVFSHLDSTNCLWKWLQAYMYIVNHSHSIKPTNNKNWSSFQKIQFPY
jgi:hypothetical protein